MLTAHPCRILITALLLAALPMSFATAQEADPEQMFADAMARGVAALEAEDYPAAIVAFRAALEIAPGHPEARTLLGTSMLESGDTAGAINQLLPIAQQFPDHYPARMNLARAYTAAGRDGAALAEFEAAVRLRPDDHGSRARLATILMRMRRFGAAATHARELARQLPDSGAAQILLGTVELERHDYAAALTAFDASLALRPEDANSRYGRAAALRGLGRDSEAVEILGELVNDVPDHADAWILFGDILAGGEDVDSKIAAVDVYRGALERRPDDARVLTSLATLFETASLDQETVELLETSVAASQDAQLALLLGRALFRLQRLEDARAVYGRATGFGSAEAFYRLGVTEVNLANLPAAEAAYRGALEIEPGHAGALRELGEVLLDQGQIDAARETLDRARAALPGDARTIYLAGIAALRSGDAATAVERLRRTLELQPGNVDALYNLGLALRDSGEVEAGRNTLTRAQAARRDAAAAAAAPPPPTEAAAEARIAGYLRFRIGSLERAAALLERATELDPEEESGWFYLGLTRAEQRQPNVAIEALERAAAIRGTRPETWELLADLYARTGRTSDAEQAQARAAELRAQSPDTPARR